jgi:hypothetical protein
VIGGQRSAYAALTNPEVGRALPDIIFVIVGQSPTYFSIVKRRAYAPRATLAPKDLRIIKLKVDGDQS